MLPNLHFLKDRLEKVIACKQQQGYQTSEVLAELERTSQGYDALADLARKIANLPLRADWPYQEPNELEKIWAACAADRPTEPLRRVDPAAMAGRVQAAFEGAVCGCILGKPLEVDPTLEEIRAAAEHCHEWPLRDYISEELLAALGRRHPSAAETTRGNIHYVAPDDDINYAILGMLVLEQHGTAFTQRDLLQLWLENLPPGWTFGPERIFLIKAALASLDESQEITPDLLTLWVSEWNPGNELCGAAIRVDAYGYAAPGNPALAAELAWRDASMTHRRTGIYAAMFVAAAIATAFVAGDPLEIFTTALKYVPQRSRFYEIVADCLDIVAHAPDWLAGYAQIHAKYGAYGHCQLYQECGLLINSARFATDVADAFCKQVAQGCDTDCFGEISGSIMGAYFGPGYLDECWLIPYNDDLRTSLATFYDRSLASVAQRMAKLPVRV
ncbi:MAG: ADP-ribosylglycohydrolase family protein [Anaerolineae bacterium]|nr:ADP-ribosylglycohydrolase family protein [Anaerolineae bacterium]